MARKLKYVSKADEDNLEFFEILCQILVKLLRSKYTGQKNSWISIFFLISLILLTLEQPIKISSEMNFDHSSIPTFPESTWVWGTIHVLTQYLKFVKNVSFQFSRPKLYVQLQNFWRKNSNYIFKFSRQKFLKLSQ